jgi:hypothetical protein
MASDVSRGPDYLSRVLANQHDEEDVEPGESPKSVLEVLSEALGEARAKAMKRVVKTRKGVQSTFTITIKDVVSFGKSGDHARLSTEVAFDVKSTKAPAIKGRGTWLDDEGNQIGQEPAQTTIKGLEGGKSDEGRRARKNAV